ncbi:MAG: hypothetical protein ACK56I_07305, partial [bacterium]
QNVGGGVGDALGHRIDGRGGVGALPHAVRRGHAQVVLCGRVGQQRRGVRAPVARAAVHSDEGRGGHQAVLGREQGPQGLREPVEGHRVLEAATVAVQL